MALEINNINKMNIQAGFVFIYVLIDPNNNKIKYVGKSKNRETLISRYSRHCREDIKTPKSNWIKSLRLNGQKPIMEILDIVKEDEWEFWEKWWIEVFISWGFKLKNLTPGGDGLPKGHIPWNKGKINVYSDDIKKKMGDAVREKFNSSTGNFKLSNEKYEEICSKYLEGKKMKDLSLEYSVCEQRVGAVLKKFNIKTRNSYSKLAHIEKSVIEYFNNNNSCKLIDIGKVFNINVGSVSKILLRNGISAKKRRNRLFVSQETKNKISLKGKTSINSGKFKKGIISHNAKVVLQLSKNGVVVREWESKNKAQVELGIKNIAKCLSGERIIAGGYKWKHKL